MNITKIEWGIVFYNEKWYNLLSVIKFRKGDMMRIKWIEFENLTTGLKINRTSFFDNSTLLVGKSGAGKTQILESIETLCNIAVNRNFLQPNVDGTICFSFDNYEYIWHVKTEEIISQTPERNSFDIDISVSLFGFANTVEKKTIIDNEFLVFKEIKNKNGNYANYEKSEKFEGFYTVFDRTKRKIKIQGYEKTPRVNKNVSLINLYNENDLFNDVYKCFNQIYEIQTSRTPYIPMSYLERLKTIEKKLQRINSIEKYRESFPNKFPIPAKLYLLKNTNKELFDELLSTYQEIFPEITGFDIKIDQNTDGLMAIYFLINDKPISIQHISMGMTKAFIFLFDLLTISNNYVVIIDEIENGLGINCIDDVYSLITSMRNDLQFIITSHHPYIINNVNPKTCKLVDRKNNIVSTYSAEELGILNSHHDFYDLIMNKMEYGITQ